MASSIKVNDQTKRSLDKLLANLMISYDLKFTQQEILDLLIKLGESNIELLLSPKKKLKSEIFTRIKKLQKPWNIDTNPETIDDMLYGDIPN